MEGTGPGVRKVEEGEVESFGGMAANDTADARRSATEVRVVRGALRAYGSDARPVGASSIASGAVVAFGDVSRDEPHGSSGVSPVGRQLAIERASGMEPCQAGSDAAPMADPRAAWGAYAGGRRQRAGLGPPGGVQRTSENRGPSLARSGPVVLHAPYDAGLGDGAVRRQAPADSDVRDRLLGPDRGGKGASPRGARVPAPSQDGRPGPSCRSRASGAPGSSIRPRPSAQLRPDSLSERGSASGPKEPTWSRNPRHDDPLRRSGFGRDGGRPRGLRTSDESKPYRSRTVSLSRMPP